MQFNGASLEYSIHEKVFPYIHAVGLINMWWVY